MSNNTYLQATTFWNFLKETSIEIPIIQRDYAQGRLGKENLRKNFLADLKNALDRNDGKKMKLDFVYGSMEAGNLYPLDGQQRLTTLWLLHWYIALRAGMLNENNCAILKKFTYETRISSREFCEKLCKPEYFKNFNGYDIVGFITKQTWFYSAWKQDPTIQSMLRMLGGTKIANKKGEDIIDGIEELFACPQLCDIDGNKCSLMKTFDSCWKKLTNETECPIVFYNLPLRDFGLSDDLYIKMNARGKQLTCFENFKADLIGYMTKCSEETCEDKQKNLWKLLLDTQNGIPIKFDTDWTDIFWGNKSCGIKVKEDKSFKSNQIDEIFFAFMNRFFWNELFIAKKSDNPSQYLLDIGKGDENSVKENENASYRYLNDSDNHNSNDYDTKIAYQGLDAYKYDNGIIPIKFFLKLQRVLNNYYSFSQLFKLPTCPWDSSFRFIPQYIVDENLDNIEISNNANEKILKVSTLNQVQRIVFFAICKYLDHDKTIEDSEDSMKQWIRVVWNLVSGEDQNGRPEIRSTSAMRSAIIFIDSLDSHKVYESLRDYDIKKLGNSSFDERCKEEIAKAKQILNGKSRSDEMTWEEIIIEAEKYAFFKGAIRFLFTDENGNINWDYFEYKWSNVQKYFDKNGNINEIYLDNALLLRALLSRIDIGEIWFGNTKDFWRISLLNRDYQRAIHYLLTTNELEIKTCRQDWIENEYLLNKLLDCRKNTWHILNNWRGFSVLTRYTQRRTFANSQKEIVVLNYLRNTLLSSGNIEVVKENKIEQTNYLYGWDIQFTYSKDNDKKYFQWHREGYVRLINDLNNCVPIIKDESKDAPEEKWYCFKPTQEMASDTSQFTEALDNLIKQSKKS